MDQQQRARWCCVCWWRVSCPLPCTRSSLAPAAPQHGHNIVNIHHCTGWENGRCAIKMIIMGFSKQLKIKFTCKTCFKTKYTVGVASMSGIRMDINDQFVVLELPWRLTAPHTYLDTGWLLPCC